jgi:hypothetical protein
MDFGMWYFGHELRFTNLGYFTNIDFRSSGNVITVTATEQRAEYGVLAGARLMQRRDGDGVTIDAYAGYAIGYKKFEVADPMFEGVFGNIDQSHLSQTFRFGLNIGFAFSFSRR